MRTTLVMIFSFTAVASAQSGPKLCALASTQADLEDCTRIVAGHAIDPAAARICGRVSTSADVVGCARAIADKVYDPSELSVCGRNSTSGGLVQCMRSMGRYPSQARYAAPARRDWPRYSAVGTWRSTSGRTFVIPDSDTDFDIVCKYTDGHKELFQGRWARTGVQFYYFDRQDRRLTATFLPGQPNLLRVDDESGHSFWWTRM